MAKKKSTKKSQKMLGLVVTCVALLFSIASVCMIFLPSINGVIMNGEEVLKENSFSGLQTSFGYSEKSELLGSQIVTPILNANILSMLAFLLPLAGAVMALLSAKGNKLFGFVGAVALVVALVFAIISVSPYNAEDPTVFADSISGAATSLFDYSLGLGSILSIVFDGLGICAFFAKVFVLKK